MAEELEVQCEAISLYFKILIKKLQIVSFSNNY